MIRPRAKAGARSSATSARSKHLQVSLKGPADFVTAADRRAEETLYEELSHARRYGFLGEEGAGARAWTRPIPGSWTRSRHLHFPARHPAFRRFDRTRTRRHVSSPAWSTNPAKTTTSFTAERGKGAFLTITAAGGGAAPTPGCGESHAGCRTTARGDLALGLKEIAAVQDKGGGLAPLRALPRSTWRGRGRALRRLLGRNISPWDVAPASSWCARRGGYATISTAVNPAPDRRRASPATR